MNRWIERKIAGASWLRFGVFFAALILYSMWAFRPDGEFQAALAAAGGNLPEMTPGFPQDLAANVFAAMNGAIADYTLFQAIDIPYAILNMLALSGAIALGLKKFKLGAHPLRYALLLPPIYLFAEFIENPLLILLANGEPGEPAAVIFIQQLATNLKWGASTGGILAALLSLIASLAALAVGVFRK